MKRAGRLQAARSFLERYAGKNVVRAYSRWFGVDSVCALIELQMLDVPVDPQLAERMRAAQRERERQSRERKERRRRALAEAEQAWLLEFGDAWELLESSELLESLEDDDPDSLDDIPF